MDAATHEALIRATTHLRTILGGADTRSVVTFCLLYHRRRAGDLEFSGDLSSPARQIAFLLGLLLSTPDPDEPGKFSVKDWERCVELLEEIFRAYGRAIWPTGEDLSSLGARWREVREVAGQALLHYHNTGLMASIDQVADRVTAYLTPFDDVVERALGIGCADTLRICDAIRDGAYARVDRLLAAADQEKAERYALVDEWERRGLSLEEFREHAAKTDYEDRFRELLSVVDDVGIIRRADLIEQFAELGQVYWDTYSIGRGDVELTYLTEANPVDTHPLIVLKDGVALFPSVNALYEAVLRVGEAVLESSTSRAAYHRARDRSLELQAHEALAEILGANATYYSSVFESPNAQHEHDLVIVSGRYLVVVEVKASPPKEPFRDPDKAFVRLQRAFRADTGIQTAYEQSEAIRRRLADGEVVELFDKSGTLLARLHPADFDEVLQVCVTRDDFGPIAVDLAHLLERAHESDPYPWAVGILDLQTIAMAWNYLSLGPEQFLKFLVERRDLHGRVICWDELDLVGFRLQHGGLHWLMDPRADRVHITPHYADVFDEIYAAINLGGPEVEIEVTKPFMGNVREMLGDMLAQLAAAKRNDPCPCGSGKKFKKCHGKPRRT